MNVFQAGLSEPDWTRETSRASVWLRCGRTASEDREGEISKDLGEPGTARLRAVFVLFLFCFYSSSFFLNVNKKSQFPESLVESGGPIHPLPDLGEYKQDSFQKRPGRTLFPSGNREGG